MIRAWILGAVFLCACATDVPTNEPEPEATEVSSEVAVPAELTPTGGEARTLEACSPPGSFRLCCPFPRGCSCRGTQECLADGQWGSCDGAAPRGQPCP